MSDTPKDGGPAFPYWSDEDDHIYHGMSLRAYFAGQAFSGLTAARASGDEETRFACPEPDDWDELAAAALEGADALLAKLEE